LFKLTDKTRWLIVDIQFLYGEQAEGTNSDILVRFISRNQLQSESEGNVIGVHPQIDAAVREFFDSGLFKAEPSETQIIPTLGLISGGHVVFVGIDAAPHSVDSLRKAAAAASRVAKRLKAEHVRILLERPIYAGDVGCDSIQAAQALTEGFILGGHERKPQRRDTVSRPAVKTVYFSPFQPEGSENPNDFGSAWEAGISRGKLFGEATCYARDLTNLPGNKLTPEKLAQEAEELATSLGIDIEVLDEWSAAEQGMGGLLGVGQGSVNLPRMIIMHYTGAPENKEVWAIVGKGITFDTGGISLKRADGMEEMISDMGGAAAVLGAMRIIGELKPAVNVIAVIPAAENMPSDRALKPGDVITSMSGRTIEIVNTDAEGRLVLADGLTAAIKRGATRIVDVATLTGAVMVALGDVATGAVTNDEVFLQQVIAAGRRSGERIWPLPSYPEYRKQIESDAADLKNSGGRYGGTITGGLFIGTFAEEVPWVHLDIAGTAWLHKDRDWEVKGATGVMTRTLAELLLHQA
jgi:leucyl aminopeptidase